MSYEEAVAASRPAFYYTLNGALGGTDKSIFALGELDEYSYGDLQPIVPSRESRGTLTGAELPLDMFATGSDSKAFSLEFWYHPAQEITDETPIPLIATVDDPASGVFYFRDRYRMQVVGSDSEIYFADCYAPDPEEIHHVVAIWASGSMKLFCNGRTSNAVELPDNVFLSGTQGMIATVLNGQHIAGYTRALSEDEIAAHYTAGRAAPGWKATCEALGATFYDLSFQHVVKAIDYAADTQQEFSMGRLRGTAFTREGYLTLTEQPDMVFMSDGEVTTPSFSSGIDLSAAGDFLTIPISQIISTNAGHITGHFTSAGGAATVWCLYDPAAQVALTLKYDTDGTLTLVRDSVDSSGSAVSESIEWDDDISSLADFQISMVFKAGQVSIGIPAVTESDSEQWVSANFPNGSDSYIMIGSNADSTGVGPTAVAVYISNFLPDDFDSLTDYTSLADIKKCTVMYDLDGQVCASHYGYMELVTQIPAPGTIYQTMADWGFPANILNNKITVTYNSVTSVLTARRTEIPGFARLNAIPGDHPPGPITILVEMETSNSREWRPVLSYLYLYAGSDQNYKADNGAGVVSSLTSAVSSRPFFVEPYSATEKHGFYLFDTDCLTIPSDNHCTVEFGFNPAGLTGTGEILCIVDGETHYNLSVSGVTLTPTGFDAVYLNAELVSGSATLRPDSLNHIVAIKNADTPVTAYLAGHAGTEGGVSSVQYVGLASYDDPMVFDDVAKNYQAFLGLYVESIQDDESLVLQQNSTPYAYSLAWQTSGATK